MKRTYAAHLMSVPYKLRYNGMNRNYENVDISNHYCCRHQIKAANLFLVCSVYVCMFAFKLLLCVRTISVATDK